MTCPDVRCGAAYYLAALLAASHVLVGCGDSQNSQSSDQGTSEPAGSSAPGGEGSEASDTATASDGVSSQGAATSVGASGSATLSGGASDVADATGDPNGGGATTDATGVANASSGGAASTNGAGGATATTTGDLSAAGTAASGGAASEPGTNPEIEACAASSATLPQSGPVVRVDFDMTGRPETEVTELGFTPWPVDAAASISRTIEDVTFSFSRAGGAGTGLKSDWFKTAIQAPSYARLVGDGLTVEEGEAGGSIAMEISGLPAGSHSLLVFLNHTSNPDTNTFAPVDIALDGSLAFDDLEPSVRAEATSGAQAAYLEFNATAGQAISITFTAETSSGASNKNVMINGFELNVPNAANQARNPNPLHADEHVAADNGDATLSWSPATSAASHDVYFGEDPEALASATHDSCEYRGNQTDTSFAVGGLSSLRTYYWRVDEISAAGEVTLGSVWMFRPRQLAFRDAEGYGRHARGGRGGRVVHVTNLNDSGSGSLREAIETDSGPRTIVFDVGGAITLGSRLVLNDRHVTVAGQTAPGKGLLIRGAPFGLSGAEDAVIRFVRVRVGAGPTFDGMGMAGSEHSIIDHASISWTIDEAFSSRSAKHITLQRTLISECLNVAGHENYPAGTEHGYAASISGDVGSFHHNLLAHCQGRNWSLAGGLDGNGDFAGRLDIFNNVVYNWRSRATDGGAHEVNFVGNYYKPGAATTLFVALNAQYESFPGTQRYYFDGNVMPGRFDEASQDQGRTYSGEPDGYSPWVDTPFFASYATVQTAGDAYKSVLSDVGSSQPVLDDHDVRVIQETLDGTTTYSGGETGYPGLPDHQNDVGGYEDYPTTSREATWDSDADGLPDFWETHYGLDPASPSGDFSDTNADPDGDGFTQLDEFLEFMAHPHEFTSQDSTASIALGDLFVGFGDAASYGVSAAVGGTATVSGTTATFSPSECGPGSFVASASDAGGASMSRKLFVFVDGC